MRQVHPTRPHRLYRIRLDITNMSIAATMFIYSRVIGLSPQRDQTVITVRKIEKKGNKLV